MSMRLIFKSLDARNGFQTHDDPEKPKRKQAVFDAGRHQFEYDDDEDAMGSIALDAKCLCNSLLFVVSVLAFGVSVFFLGAASQQQNLVFSTGLERERDVQAARTKREREARWGRTKREEEEDEEEIESSSPPSPPSPPSPLQSPPFFNPFLESSTPDRNDTNSGLAAQRQAGALRVNDRRIPVEYIHVSFEERLDANSVYFANVDKCVKLILDAAAVQIKSIETQVADSISSVFVRPFGDADGAFEALADGETQRKLRYCSGRKLLGEPKFVYR